MSRVIQKEHLREPHAGDDKGARAGQAFGGTSLEVTSLDKPLKKQLDGFAAIGIQVVLPNLQRDVGNCWGVRSQPPCRA
jgi:hypothetical protein